MTRRERAIATIVADVARNGVAGRDSIRAYVENRISRATFNEAVAKGMSWHNRAQAPAQPKEEST